MAYQFLRKNLAMDKFIVQEILKYIPEKKISYTLKTSFMYGDLAGAEFEICQSKYYRLVFIDCMEELIKKNEPISDSEDEDFDDFMKELYEKNKHIFK